MVLSVREAYKAVDDYMIEQIASTSADLRSGTSVRIVKGAYVGRSGVILSKNGSHYTVRVSLGKEYINDKYSIDQLEKI